MTRELLQMSAPAAALNKAIARNEVRDDVENFGLSFGGIAR